MTHTDPETARALLWRHGLPEDVIDGALCLHAQELAAEIREETRRLKADGVLEPDKYRPCRDAANQIDPTRNEDDPDAPAVSGGVSPATGSAAEAVAKRVTRAIFALKTPTPPGSQHYLSGWDDGLEAAMDAARDAVLSVLPAATTHTWRATVLTEADWIVEHCPDHGCVEPETEVCHCEIADRLRRLAAEPAAAVGAGAAATPEREPVVVHAVPLPGSNGISACCGRPPCEFVGERVTRDLGEVTCPGPDGGPS